MMRLVSRLMALVVGVVLIASIVSVAVAAVPPCNKLLTPQDITNAAGPGFEIPGEGAPAALRTGCLYNRRGKDQAGNYLEEAIQLVLQENPGGAVPKLVEISSGFRISGASVGAASGLGPSAFYREMGDGSTWVFFGKGNLYVRLTYKVGKQSDPKAALALAKVVYGRL
jgi:hypothetical protein